MRDGKTKKRMNRGETGRIGVTAVRSESYGVRSAIKNKTDKKKKRKRKERCLLVGYSLAGDEEGCGQIVVPRVYLSAELQEVTYTDRVPT